MAVYLDTLPPQAPALAAWDSSATQPPSLMRLRVTDGDTVWAVLATESAQDLAAELGRLRPALPAGPLEVHLWHAGAWWNLSADLGQFFAWRLEATPLSQEETRRFAGAPLSRPDWLYDAARQMQRLLEAALGSDTSDPKG